MTNPTPHNTDHQRCKLMVCRICKAEFEAMVMAIALALKAPGADTERILAAIQGAQS